MRPRTRREWEPLTVPNLGGSPQASEATKSVPQLAGPDRRAGAFGNAPARQRATDAALWFVEAYGLLLLLLLACLFFAVWPTTGDLFLSTANLQVLLASPAVTAIVALGVLLPLICQEFDLSVGAIAGLAAVVVASLLSNGVPVPIALLAGAGLGLAVGMVNGVLVTRIGVNGVVATLGTASVLTGVVIQSTGGLAVVSDIPRTVIDFGSSNFLGIPLSFWTLLVVATVIHVILSYTAAGRQVYAIGSNPDAARLVGIRIKLIVGASFGLGGALAGAAGVLYVARAGGADPSVGDTLLLPAFAGAFLSAAAVKPGQYNVWGAILAIYFLAVLNNGLTIAGAPNYVQNYVNGVALVAGIALATVLYRRRTT